MSIVNELNDNCFVMATEFFVELSDAILAEVGRRPTLGDVCEILTWGMKGCAVEILSDADASTIEGFVCKAKKSKPTRLVPGDVVAVPAGGGRYYLGVFIASNRIGYAYGFFRGTWALRSLQCGALKPLGRPVYSSKRAVDKGVWRIVARNTQLLTLFPADPEIYHAKRHHTEDPLIGPFGTAEAVSGETLRALSEEEAKTIGLLDGSYRQVVLEDSIVEYLHRLNATDE